MVWMYGSRTCVAQEWDVSDALLLMPGQIADAYRRTQKHRRKDVNRGQREAQLKL